MNSKARNTKLLSFHSLKFEEAVTDILKIKPEPKPPKPENAKPAKDQGRNKAKTKRTT